MHGRMIDHVLHLIHQAHRARIAFDLVDALGGPMTPEVRTQRMRGAQAFAKGSAERLMRATRMGVRVAFGSDEYYDVPGSTRGQASLLTLQAYQEAGMSPIDVLRTATINSAELLGMSDRIGTIEAGKLADIIAVEGDPLRDAKDLRKTRFVMKGGVVIRNDAGMK